MFREAFNESDFFICQVEHVAAIIAALVPIHMVVQKNAARHIASN